MNNSNDNGHSWNQKRIIVLLPLIIFVWMIGWALYWIGTQNVVKNCQKEKHNGFQKMTITKETYPTAVNRPQ